MYSNIAFASWTRVFHFFRSSSSICIDDPKDSTILLSSALTTPVESFVELSAQPTIYRRHALSTAMQNTFPSGVGRSLIPATQCSPSDSR